MHLISQDTHQSQEAFSPTSTRPRPVPLPVFRKRAPAFRPEVNCGRGVGAAARCRPVGRSARHRRRCRRSRSQTTAVWPASNAGPVQGTPAAAVGTRCLEGVHQPGQVGVGEDRMAVLRHENQVGVQRKDAVPACANVPALSHEPSILVGMRLRYSYRVYPATAAGRGALARTFGCARVVFNDGLRAREDAYQAGLPYLSDGELSRRLTLVKRTPERAWLGEVSAVVLQQSLADLHHAYRNWFRDLERVKAARARGEKAKLRVRKPRFKSRQHDQAVRFTANSRFRLLPDGRLSLPKVGDVKIRWSRPLPAEPSSVTVTLDGAGRFHASFVVEVREAPLPATDTAVGSTSASPRSPPSPPGRRSTTRAGCGSGSGRCGAPSATWPASGRGQGTGRRPAARSPACTPGWPTLAGTSTTSSPPAWSASTGRSVSRR
jgi:Helix-turn-helix domain